MSETPHDNKDFFDPHDPEDIEQAIQSIYAPDGPLAQQAAGDANYLRFLQANAVASLDALQNPHDDEVVQRFHEARQTLEGYEKEISTGKP
jgi:hypothetical protein